MYQINKKAQCLNPMYSKQNQTITFPTPFQSRNCDKIKQFTQQKTAKKQRKWGVQDSNLRRLSQQIYSLSRLTASVTPRFNFLKNAPVIRHFLWLSKKHLSLTWSDEEPAEGVEPTTCWLQISCSANWATLAGIMKTGKYIEIACPRNTKRQELKEQVHWQS